MEHLQVERHGTVAVLTVNRPEVLNALNEAVMRELLHFLQESADKAACRALILIGAGSKAFIAGADIKQMSGMNHQQMLRFCELGQRVTMALEQAPFLTIAAVNGYALGGGLEMALACDFIYASQSAKMGLPEVTLGIIPGFGGTQRLARAIGTRQAKEVIMNGKMLSAEQAHNLGLVNRVCSDAALLEDCLETAQGMVKYSALAIAQIKRAVDGGYAMSLADGMELERNMCAVCFATPEREQGMAAFLKKVNK